MSSAVSYLRESAAELRKVKWPTRELTIQYSIVVLTSVIVLTAFLAGIDYLLTQLVDLILV